MPLGARDIMLVIRARNDASGVLSDVGRALSAFGGNVDAATRKAAQQTMALGVGIAAIGVAFLAAGAAASSFFHEAAMEAVEYNRATALTLTQIDEVGVSLSTIGDIGKRVAKDIPAPFDQMQKSLYDIFSSMNVNVEGSERLLRAFSKAAVAGQVDVQAAARASIAIMNSYKIPVEDVSRVMDIQFQLVRKGVGTYQEFAEVIGRVTPSAVSAGQSVETMAGMLAFLTRNGLSAAMAAASASRAFELMTDPKTQQNLQNMGVRIKDASGEFLQMKDIIGQLVNDKGWGKMTGPELKNAFEDTFGQGTIQARRFFDLAIPNFSELVGLTDDMTNSAGAMETAYGTMSETTASKLQQLNNRFDIIKVNIGERLIPTVEKVANVFMKLADAWDNLSPGTQDIIIRIAALAATLAVIVGVVLTVVGGFLIFAGAAAAAGVGLVLVAKIVAIVVAAFALLVGIVFMVITHWETLVGWFNTAKEAILGLTTLWEILGTAIKIILAPILLVVAAIIWLVQNFDMLRNKAGEIWEAIENAFANIVGTVQGWIQTLIDWLTGTAIPFIQYWVNSVLEQFNLFAAWFSEHVGPVITAVGELIAAIGERFGQLVDIVEVAIQFIWDIIQNVWTFISPFIMEKLNQLWEIMQFYWDIIQNVVKAAWDFIWHIIQFAWDIIQNVVKAGVDFVKWVIENWGDNLVDFIQIVWDMIVGLIEAALQIIRGVINIVTGIISGDWGKVWEGIKNVAQGIWNAIWAVISSVLEQIANVVRAVIDGIAHFFGSSWNNIRNGIVNAWNSFRETISNKLNEIASSIRNAVQDWLGIFSGVSLWDAGRRIIDGLINGIKSGIETVKSTLSGLTAMIPDWKGPPARDKNLLYKNGQLIMDGLGMGLAAGWGDIKRQLQGYGPSITGSVGVGSGSVGSFASTGARVTVSSGAVQVYISIDNATEDVEEKVQAGVQAALSQMSDAWAGFDAGTP